MDSRRFVCRETASIAIGEIVLVGAMLIVFRLANCFDQSVLLGGLIGGAVSVLNFFVMALGAAKASEKAVSQDVKGGKALMYSSYAGRYVAIFVLLALLVKAGVCHPLACVLPLAFAQPVMYLKEYIKKRKPGE